MVAERVEAGRLAQAHDPVYFSPQFSDGLRRRHWKPNHNLTRRTPFEGAYRHFHRRSRGDTVVDEDRCPAGDRQRRSTRAIDAPAPIQFRPFAVRQGPKVTSSRS